MCSRISIMNGPSIANCNLNLLSELYDIKLERFYIPAIKRESDDAETTGRLLRDLIFYRECCGQEDKPNLDFIIDELCVN